MGVSNMCGLSVGRVCGSFRRLSDNEQTIAWWLTAIDLGVISRPGQNTRGKKMVLWNLKQQTNM